MSNEPSARSSQDTTPASFQNPEMKNNFLSSLFRRLASDLEERDVELQDLAGRPDTPDVSPGSPDDADLPTSRLDSPAAKPGSPGVPSEPVPTTSTRLPRSPTDRTRNREQRSSQPSSSSQSYADPGEVWQRLLEFTREAARSEPPMLEASSGEG